MSTPYALVCCRDEPVTARAASILASAGVASVAVPDTASLHAAAASEPPDLVIFDLSLVGRAGLATIRRLRFSAPTARLLVLSPLGRLLAALASGADACIDLNDLGGLRIYLEEAGYRSPASPASPPRTTIRNSPPS